MAMLNNQRVLQFAITSIDRCLGSTWIYRTSMHISHKLKKN